MAEGKKGFVVYVSWKTFLEDLTDEQLGKWFRWVMDYCNDKDPEFPSDQAVKISCKMTQSILKRDLKKYEAKVESIQKAREKRKNANDNNIEINNEINIDNNAEITTVNSNKLLVNSNKLIELSKDNNNNIVSKDTRSNTYDLNTAFEYFWGLYPKKVGKQKCLNWFKTHHPKRDLVAKMCEAVKNQSKSEQWTKDDGKYIPMCYTWLNRGGWDDILEKEMPKSEFDINGGFEEL